MKNKIVLFLIVLFGFVFASCEQIEETPIIPPTIIGGEETEEPTGNLPTEEKTPTHGQGPIFEEVEFTVSLIYEALRCALWD